MISDEIAGLADRISGYGLRKRAMEPEVAAALAAHLAYIASRVACLESLPFAPLLPRKEDK